MSEDKSLDAIIKRAAVFRKEFAEMMQRYDIEHATLSVAFSSGKNDGRYAQMAMMMFDGRVVPQDQVTARHYESVVSIAETLNTEQMHHEFHAPVGRA